MENIMLNVKKSLINALFIIVLTCGLSNDVQAGDWGTWISSKTRAVAAQVSKTLQDAPATWSTTNRESFSKHLTKNLEDIQNGIDLAANWNTVKIFIKSGADVNTLYNNVTALYLAATEVPSNEEMVQFLLAHDADQHAGNPSYADYLETQKILQQTEVQSSASNKKAPVTQKTILSPEKLYEENNNLKAQVEWLMDSDNLPQNDIETGFYQIRNAINNGADVNYVDEKSEFKAPALNAAAKYINEEMIRFLLSHGANPSLTDAHGKTALQITLENTQTYADDEEKQKHIWNIVKHLINRGANVNTKIGNGNTALHLAIYNQDPVMTHFLLINKADLNLKGSNGKKAIDIAQSISESNGIAKEQIINFIHQYQPKYREEILSSPSILDIARTKNFWR